MRLSFVALTLSVSLGACVVGEEASIEELDEEAALKGENTAAIRIVQHNVEKKQGAIDNAIQKAKASGAIGITLQEVCPDQLQRLIDQHGGEWTIGVVSSKRPAITGCDLPDGTHAIPNTVVIWTGGKNGRVTPYPSLSAPANAPGEMVCVELEKAKVPVHLCSAHLISAKWTDPTTGTVYDGEELREKQTTRIKRLANDEWFGGNKNHFGIVGGDFNGKPDSTPLDKMYAAALGGTGDFTEYNRSGNTRNGQITATASGNNTEDGQPYSKKIDYIFFSTNRASVNGPAVTIDPDAADHDMVTSTVQMRK